MVHMETDLHQRIIGKNEAVAAVAEAIRRSRSGLSDPRRPIGSFIFLGPTGVGKTELAKALAEFLFDEIEKAHPDVFNILLQILEDGRLTDGQGHTVDFRNPVIIMTSNLGTEGLRHQPFGFRTAGKEEQDEMRKIRGPVNAALKRTFRPEFLNRIDDTIVFHPLNRDQVMQIVALMIRDVKARLTGREITFELTPEAELWLAKEGFDPVYGAGPLRRAIQRQLENPLARMVLSGEVKTGAHVVVDAGHDSLVLTRRDSPVNTGSCSSPSP